MLKAFGYIERVPWIEPWTPPPDHDTNISVGNSEKGAHVCSKIGKLICLLHLFRAKAVANLKLFQKIPDLLQTCLTFSELPSYNIKHTYTRHGFVNTCDQREYI